MPVCNRDNFQDTLHDLSGLLAKPEQCNQAVWKVEYLSRKGWHHFYGMIRSGASSGVGHVYDRIERRALDVPFDDCVSVALGFLTNASISTYAGKRSVTTDILEEVETRGCVDAEVVRFGIEARTTQLGGRKVMAVTDIVFIGLSNTAQQRRITAITSEVPSVKWCRDRRFISASPILSPPADLGFAGI